MEQKTLDLGIFDTLQIIEISEREQRRIGQDLHDSLGQILTGIAFISKMLEQKLSAKGLAEADHAAEIARLVRDAIDQTRSLSRTLNPVRLEAEGLMMALDELAYNTKSIFGINCRITYDKPVCIKHNLIAKHLYRIAQEAVNNAIRHGKAKNIEISVNSGNKFLVLTVKDDGIGFSADEKRNGGMGLRIMEYRAHSIGAILDIRLNPGGGTLLVCSLKQRHKKAV